MTRFNCTASPSIFLVAVWLFGRRLSGVNRDFELLRANTLRHDVRDLLDSFRGARALGSGKLPFANVGFRAGR